MKERKRRLHYVRNQIRGKIQIHVPSILMVVTSFARFVIKNYQMFTCTVMVVKKFYGRILIFVQIAILKGTSEHLYKCILYETIDTAQLIMLGTSTMIENLDVHVRKDRFVRNVITVLDAPVDVIDGSLFIFALWIFI